MTRLILWSVNGFLVPLQLSHFIIRQVLVTLKTFEAARVENIQPSICVTFNWF